VSPEKIEQIYYTLKRITQYQTVSQLRKASKAQYGLDFDEAIEYAYENIIAEARAGLSGVRLPKRRPPENDKVSAPNSSPEAEQEAKPEEVSPKGDE